MTAAFTIPFNEIIEKAFLLRDEHPDLSIDDMVKEILPNIHIKFQSDVPISLRKKTIKDETEKVEKKKELTLDERCMARTIYEEKHMSNGILTVMRDDPKNLYGDRCKCRKKDGSHFCSKHSNWQTLGVWNGEYSGKFAEYVQKTKLGSVCQITDEDEPPKPVTKPAKKKDSKETVVQKEKMVKPSLIGGSFFSSTTSIDSNQAVLDDEDSIMAYPIQIDGIEYNIDDSTNHVYTDEGDLIGVYDRLNKKWLSKI